jgi:hypothetical protein
MSTPGFCGLVFFVASFFAYSAAQERVIVRWDASEGEGLLTILS